MDIEEQPACKDKAAFATEEQARAAATQAAWRYQEPKTKRLKPYLCPHCQLYHLATDYQDDII